MDELAACDADDTTARLTLQFRMATLLLTRNYNLADHHFRELLVVDADDPVCRDRWGVINRAMTGRVPKPLADGSASP
ncbi:hypothetical protein [Paludisphaera mucosa]|uniref:Uncharacterized protein n=1 Tax=Paludisphaera mucosa TaxID=3030827 RepID=A0ABT6FD40_9BACT|nr:hypothetical protein [Paludisphaera mucosa]MDG3005499.1 hypothetical protein [Paludisphaera mucosa]